MNGTAFANWYRTQTPRQDVGAGRWLGICCLICTGCNDAPVGHVTGTVTLDGNPVPAATVTFQPQTGPAVVGITDSSGHFALEPVTGTRGIATGHYHVSVGTYRIDVDPQGQPVEHAETIPAKYNAQSQIQRDVQAGDQLIDLQLSSRP